MEEGILVGMGSRLFLIDDDDSLERVSLAQLSRLLRFDKRVALPQYAGKRIRCAMAILEVAGRQVLTIRHIDYFVLPFDAEGRIDKEEWTGGYVFPAHAGMNRTCNRSRSIRPCALQ